MKLSVLSGVVAAFTTLVPDAGQAKFTFCNQTLDVANVAISAFNDGAFESSGWWVVGPNQCAEVISQSLRSRFVYVFAKDVFGRALLDGVASMCVDTGRFQIRGEEECLTRGYIDARFHEVDTQQSDSWTFFLRSAAD
ncbi:DUF1036 domain-containing protein [Tritonibacter mobilis]|uniref:DUF1036 domain-containing protein n=1 Tax=Tritonibacter mobilis TaxID=379347 RepID=UPI0014451577|nr:DUF1036 domain-containing protein [Rhodobacteraceae bacterium R_SAG5]